MNLYEQTIPQLLRTLGQVHRWLDKAAAHAEARKFDPETLLHARLAPDMFPFRRQIQSLSDTAKLTAARLTGAQAPSFPDNEQTLAELRARVDKTVDYLKSLKEADFAGADERTITMSWMPGKGVKGCDYLVQFGLPNFYFHAAMTYAILRHNGVDVGKADFIGPMSFFDV